MAEKAAEALREGRRVVLMSGAKDGEVRVEEVVGVPGFPDGRQLPSVKKRLPPVKAEEQQG